MTDETAEPGAHDSPEQGETPDPVDRLIAVVGEDREKLTELDEKVEWLLGKFTPDGEQKHKPVSWSWRYATGGARAKLWQHISGYVEWINHRYFAEDHTRYIPACWYRHGAVVEELTGMWAAWFAASYDHRGPTADVADYHRRFFWPGLAEIQRHISGCRDRGHQEHVPVDLSPDEGLEGFIDRDVLQHPDQNIDHTV